MSNGSGLRSHLPTDVRGVERVDDRRVISGIVHVLRSGCRWCDCPPEYGPPTTIYNRFVRWARRGVWENLFRELAGGGRIEKRVQQAEGLQAHCNPLRQAGAKLPGLCLPRRCSCMVDLMSWTLIAIVMDEIDARVPDIARRVLKVIVSQIEDILAKPLQPRGFVSPCVCLPGKPKSAYIHASSGVIWGLTVNGRNDAVQLTLKGIAHEALLCPRRLLHGPAHRRP